MWILRGSSGDLKPLKSNPEMARLHPLALVWLASLLCSPASCLQLLLHARRATSRSVRRVFVRCEENSAKPADNALVVSSRSQLTPAEVAQVGNLAEDDEWLGLAMELGIVLRCAIRESVKANVRDFTGKDNYKIGDISKEADARIKEAVANMRGKDEYELGDLAATIDAIAKDEVCKITGKSEYQMGDLTVEVDKRVKSTVADFCGKEDYEVGDLTREINSRVESRVLEFTGNSEYEFGDIVREIERRRSDWVTQYIGKQDYEFGDLTKTMIKNFTGKDDYDTPALEGASIHKWQHHFLYMSQGDITKKAIQSFTGKDDYQFGDITKKIGQTLFGNKPTKRKD